MIQVDYSWVRHYEFQRRIATHDHGSYEFVYYLSGAGDIVSDGKKIRFGQDNYSITPPHVPHSESHDGYGSVVIVGFHFTDGEEMPYYFSHLQSQTILNLSNRIRFELRDHKPHSADMINSLMNEIVIHIQRKITKPSKGADQKMNQAVEYLNNHFTERVDFASLAKRLGYCTDYFRIQFRKAAGVSPKAYVLNKRVELAETLLAQGDLPLQEVGERVGFEYYSRFSLFFKEKTGVSPGTYRKKLFTD